jgi:hypothetical protein
MVPPDEAVVGRRFTVAIVALAPLAHIGAATRRAEDKRPPGDYVICRARGVIVSLCGDPAAVEQGELHEYRSALRVR